MDEIKNIRKRHCINAIKVFAVLLIINSHIEVLYPDEIKFVSSGGAIGNSIFFIISGFFLHIREGFWLFCKKKFLRIYPTCWIALWTGMLLGVKSIPCDFQDILTTFIWPTTYWYIGALILFEIIVYIFEKFKICQNKIFLSLICIWILYYIFLIDKTSLNIEASNLLTVAGFYKCIYLFALFYCGYVLGNKFDYNFLPADSSKVIKSSFACFLICFIISYFIKYAIFRYSFLMKFQGVIQLLNCMIAISILLWAITYENMYSHKMKKEIVFIIDKISAYSLEIYMVQFAVIAFSEKVLLIKFCISWYSVIMCTLLIIGLAAFVLKSITKNLLSILVKLEHCIVADR